MFDPVMQYNLLIKWPDCYLHMRAIIYEIISIIWTEKICLWNKWYFVANELETMLYVLKMQ